MIEISDQDAQTIVAVIDYSESLERLLRATHESLKDAGIIDRIPMPPHPEAALIVHELRDRLQAGTITPMFTDPTRILRAIATRGDTGTTSDLADHFGVTQQQIEPWLTELEELEYIRDLLDGYGNLTWEITPAGEAQL